jgi:hypothetical protein
MEELDTFGENRWLRFGLSTNPYFVQPLNSSDSGPRPISLFQGRAAQGKQLADSISGEESSLNIVEAPSGVGKSTFVNFVKYRLRRRYFAPPSEIGVQSDWNSQAVLLGVLDVIVRYASDVAPETDWKKYPVTSKARELVSSIQQASWSLSLGVSPGTPVGASLGLSRSGTSRAPLLGPVLSPSFMGELVSELLSLTTPPADGAIVHVNNLDTLMAASVTRTRTLLSDLRDYFQVTNLHWVLVGPPGLHEEAIAPERRVMSIAKDPIDLDKLPFTDFEGLLKKRYQHYALEKSWTDPTEQKLVREVYRLFGGDLRGTLNALTRAHGYYNPLDVQPLSEGDGLAVLAGHFRAHLRDKLAPKPRKVLEHLAALGEEEFTQDDAKPVEKHQPARSKHFAELEQWEAIRLVRTEGPRKIYSLGGAALLAHRA